MTATSPTITASRSGSTEASEPGSHHGHVEVSAARAAGQRSRPSSSRGSARCRAAAPTARRAWSRPRCSSAAARGSVPRTSRFSSSDSVIVRRLSSSSTSSASKNAVSLCGRELGVVVEDDRRAQHHAGLVGRARPAPGRRRRCRRPPTKPSRPLRRVQQRDERGPFDLEEQVAGHERAAQPVRAGRRRGPPSVAVRFSTRRDTSVTAYGDTGRSTVVNATRSGASVRDQSADEPARRAASSISVPPSTSTVAVGPRRAARRARCSCSRASSQGT